MAFTLTESAQDHWCAVNARPLAPQVRAGPTFSNGKLVERSGGETQPEAAQTILIRWCWQSVPCGWLMRKHQVGYQRFGDGM